MDTLTWLRILCAGAVGFVAWHSQMWAIPLSILAPCLATVQPNRTAAAAASWAYYAAASFPAVAVARAYWPSLSTGAVLIWLAASAILALPWILCWTRRQVLRPWNTNRRCGAQRNSAAVYRGLGIAAGIRRRAIPKFRMDRPLRHSGTARPPAPQRHARRRAHHGRHGQSRPERPGEASAAAA